MKSLQDCGHERLKLLKRIAWSRDDEDTDGEVGHALLKTKTSIDGEQRVELRLSQGEKLSIPFASPTLLRGCPNLVAG